MMAVTVDDRQGRARGHRSRLAEAARRALAAVGRAGADLDLTIVGDAEIRALNHAFRGVRRRTDVLAFPLEVPGGPASLVGQVVISADTARRQARRVRVPLEAELTLLVTHGVLHLVGWDDRDPVEAALMHAREREILAGAGRRWPVRLWTGLPGG
jgi:probable rRNA maturation factor